MTPDPTVHDAVVVGAGPAGALAARELARAGLDVLLVDKQRFPRPKVCGACVNGRALAALEAAGLADLTPRLGGVRLGRFALRAGGRGCELALPGGVAVSRRALDAELVDAALAAGVRLAAGTRAVLGPLEGERRWVDLRAGDTSRRVSAAAVIAADGLGGGFLAPAPEFEARTAPGSRIGVGGESHDAPSSFAAGTIYMAVGRAGYVGLVRVEDGALNVAAALDAAPVRERGIAATVDEVLREAGFAAGEWVFGTPWKGTPPLTRSAARVARERVFVVGDAAGYVEPFTGEGMAWAFESALAVAPLVTAAVRRSEPSTERRWNRVYRRRIRSRQLWCRGIARGLRHPRLVRLAVRALAGAPRLAAPLVGRLAAAPRGAGS